VSVGKQIKEIEDMLSRVVTAPHTKDPKYHRFQGYDHQVIVRPRTLEMVNWCNQHCQDDYSLDAAASTGDKVSFKNAKDAMLFKLTWGGA